MRYYLISDNHDTLTGMRLAGIEGTLVRDREGVEAALQAAKENPDIGIVLITRSLVRLAADKVDDMKLHCPRPLILEIPDRNGSDRSEDSITRYIREAIGIKM